MTFSSNLNSTNCRRGCDCHYVSSRTMGRKWDVQRDCGSTGPAVGARRVRRRPDCWAAAGPFHCYLIMVLSSCIPVFRTFGADFTHWQLYSLRFQLSRPGPGYRLGQLETPSPTRRRSKWDKSPAHSLPVAATGSLDFFGPSSCADPH